MDATSAQALGQPQGVDSDAFDWAQLAQIFEEVSASGRAGQPTAPLISINERKACHEERIKRYGKAKAHSHLTAEWGIKNPSETSPERAERARAQAGCGGFLAFRRALEGPDQDWKLRSAKFCQQTHTCNLCGIRRAAKAHRTVFDRVLYTLTENPSLVPYFVTLTVRDGASLAESFGRLDRALKRLMDQRRVSSRRGAGSPMRVVLGGVGQIETKRGRNSRQWHPHFHGLFLVDPSLAANKHRPIDYDAFRLAWNRATEQEHASNRITRINSEFLRSDVTSEQYREALGKDLCEIVKYSVKFGDEESAEDLWHVGDVLRGRTLLRSFGILRGLVVPDELTDEPLNWEEFDYIDRFYGYVGQATYKQLSSEVEHIAFHEWRHETKKGFNNVSKILP